MKIVKIKGRELASVVITGKEILELLPEEMIDLINENEAINPESTGLGEANKFVITAPFCEIEDTPEAIKEATGI